MRLADFRPTPATTWRPPVVSQLPAWRGAKRVAIDCETNDPQLTDLGIGVRRGGYVVGVSFAIEGGPAHYLPIRHQGGGNLDRDHVCAYLRDQGATFTGEIVGANLGYDVEYLALDLGVEFNPRRFLDVQVVEPLLDELQLSYSLDNILRRHGLPGKDETLLRQAAGAMGIDPKKDLWRLPGEMVGAYAEGDVTKPLELIRRQEAMIDEQGLRAVFDRECRLLPVLIRMRRRGVRIDQDRLAQVETWARAREAAACEEVHRLTGHRIGIDDCNKKQVLLPILREAGITLPKTATGQESVTSGFLATLTHPWGKAIIEAKRFNKLRTTFAESVRAYMTNGRLHCTLRQSRIEREGDDESEGARFGRLSCVDPNLQQQPARDKEIAPVWRSIYMPDDGGQWACLDVSQQEPRWAIHYAEALRCAGAREAAERYRVDPATDAYTLISQLAGVSRDEAKTITLGLLYGMGGGKLCTKLNLPVREVVGRGGKTLLVAGDAGQRIIDTFDRKVPFLRSVARIAQQRAEERGWVVTAGGRRCRFPRHGRRFDWTHKALNRVVQGSSGDQIREAMVVGDAAGYPLQLQVHDELDLTFNGDVRTLLPLAEMLKSALPCSVPHKVDIEVGPNWGTIRKVPV